MRENNKIVLISVVMLNFNGLTYLKKTIPKILKLNWPNYEFVIIDNGSTDGSIEFINKFDKIRLIKNGKNLGYSKGKNIGVKNARGKYILLLDNDMIIENKNILSDLLKFYSSKKNIAFVSTTMINLNEKKTIMYGCFYSFYGQREKKLIYPSKLPKDYIVPAPSGGNIFFKKDIWKKLGGYDESFPFNIDDYDIGARSVIYGYNNYILNLNPIVHIGIFERLNNKKWCWKYRYYLSGYSTIIIKNYKYPFIYLGIYHAFMWIKTLKNVLCRKTICPIYSLIYSYYIFLKNLPAALQKRKIIQSKRVVKEDIFLKIKPPKFD